MKTTPSIPDAHFQKAKKPARKMKKSRSQLCSNTISEHISRHDRVEVSKRLDKLYSELDSVSHRSLSEAARQVLVSAEW